jgi:hypothetical protein
MRKQELVTLKPGDNVNHRRYGLSSVVEITYSFGGFFGMVILPKTKEGKQLLAQDCGVPDIPLLEDSLRRLSIAEGG